MNRRSGFTPSLQYESGEYKTKKEVLNEFTALSRHSNQEELARIMNNESDAERGRKASNALDILEESEES